MSTFSLVFKRYRKALVCHEIIGSHLSIHTFFCVIDVRTHSLIGRVRPSLASINENEMWLNYAIGIKLASRLLSKRNRTRPTVFGSITSEKETFVSFLFRFVCLLAPVSCVPHFFGVIGRTISQPNVSQLSPSAARTTERPMGREKKTTGTSRRR